MNKHLLLILLGFWILGCSKNDNYKLVCDVDGIIETSSGKYGLLSDETFKVLELWEAYEDGSIKYSPNWLSSNMPDFFNFGMINEHKEKFIFNNKILNDGNLNVNYEILPTLPKPVNIGGIDFYKLSFEVAVDKRTGYSKTNANVVYSWPPNSYNSSLILKGYGKCKNTN